MRVQVAVQEGEQRELGNLVAAQRWDDATRVPIQISGCNPKRNALEGQSESMNCPCQAPEDRDRGFPAKCALCTQLLQLLIDKLDRSQVAEQDREAGRSNTADER